MNSNYSSYIEMQSGLTARSESSFTLIPETALTVEGIIQRLKQQTLLEGNISYQTLSDSEISVALTEQGQVFQYHITVMPSRSLGAFEYLPRLCRIDTDVQQKASESRQHVSVSSTWLDDPFLSWHLQMCLNAIVVPDLLLGQDDTAGAKLFTREWLCFQIQTFAAPPLSTFYCLQAVDEENEYWVHTHGLRRLGLPEFEITVPRSDEGLSWAEGVISTCVDMYLEDGKALFYEPLPVARTAHGDVWVSGLPWEQALEFVDSTKYLEHVSSMTMLSDTQLRALKCHSEDRDEWHSGPSVCIFHLVGKRGRLEKLPALSLLAEQPTYYKSARSSIREAETARLRWPYFQHLFEQRTHHQPWSFMVKAAIPYADDQNENMWFIPEEINADTFDAILINKPIYVQNMSENNRYTLSIEQINDWSIGTQNGSITANNVYQLISVS
ncbi:DUF4026 domain-containing protein [Klebsiella aerogenes]|uniref:DUF4026 domain-containing protein n=1 Tax=Klebsiella aerogenes TaxID=548 RepID=A0AAP9R211_KLEAE|nr:DUF4026 domain-containing protein [Klebsiella aerogenes]QMR43032.1 DUF4026 domain-containing protein [Klebsiella aerogenes]